MPPEAGDDQSADPADGEHGAGDLHAETRQPEGNPSEGPVWTGARLQQDSRGGQCAGGSPS